MPGSPSAVVAVLLLSQPLAVALSITSEGAQFEALADWISREGGFVGSVIAASVDGLRGLYATADVQAGEPLLAVPRHCVICAMEGEGPLKLHEQLMLQLLEARSEGSLLAPHCPKHQL